MSETVLDPAEWPRWFHHVELESVLCETPDDAEALPAGFRKQPFSEDEKYAHAKAEEAKAQRGHKAAVARLEDELEQPVTARPKTAHAKVPYRRPSRAKVAPYGRRP